MRRVKTNTTTNTFLSWLYQMEQGSEGEWNVYFKQTRSKHWRYLFVKWASFHFFQNHDKEQGLETMVTKLCTKVRESVVADGNWDACSHLLLLYLFLTLLFGYCPLNQIKYYPSSSSFWTQTKGSLLLLQWYDSLLLLIPLNFVLSPIHNIIHIAQSKLVNSLA
jgi:hypothetical protein